MKYYPNEVCLDDSLAQKTQ